jgi:hypothetical protein
VKLLASASEPPVSATSDGYRPVLVLTKIIVTSVSKQMVALQGMIDSRRLATASLQWSQDIL